MSLLQRGTTSVQFYPEVRSRDGDDNPVRVPGATPVTVYGLMQPAASTEDVIDGQAVATTYTFLCRDLPAGAWAHAAWGGRTWSVDGEPARRGDSPATAHVTVRLRARTAEPPP